LRTGNFQAANGGRKLRQQGWRKNSVASGGADLANVRTGVRGGEVAAKVQLRSHKYESQEKNRNAQFWIAAPHKLPSIKVMEEMMGGQAKIQ